MYLYDLSLFEFLALNTYSCIVLLSLYFLRSAIVLMFIQKIDENDYEIFCIVLLENLMKAFNISCVLDGKL